MKMAAFMDICKLEFSNLVLDISSKSLIKTAMSRKSDAKRKIYPS